jgi:hypothetical protein
MEQSKNIQVMGVELTEEEVSVLQPLSGKFAVGANAEPLKLSEESHRDIDGLQNIAGEAVIAANERYPSEPHNVTT